jgi:hypothetical protein
MHGIVMFFPVALLHAGEASVRLSKGECSAGDLTSLESAVDFFCGSAATFCRFMCLANRCLTDRSLEFLVMTWRLHIPSKQASRCGVRSTFVAIFMAHAMTNKSRIFKDFPGT